MTQQDLDIYLNMIAERTNHYRVEHLVRPDPYNLKEIKKLDQMAVEAMAKFHEKDL